MINIPYSSYKTCTGDPNSPWAIEARNIAVQYERSKKPALEGIYLAVPKGSRIALVGANGAGKSSLLKALTGLLPLVQGSLKIMGHENNTCKHRLVYLPQRGELDWSFPLSVRRLVGTGRYVHLGWFKRPKAEDKALVEQALQALELEDLADRQISELSGGQQQRCLLARCLCQDSDIFLLDEPLNALDQKSIQIIQRVLDDLKQKGRTVLTATHDLGRLESDFDGALYLHEGKVLENPQGSFKGLALGREVLERTQAQNAAGQKNKIQLLGDFK